MGAEPTQLSDCHCIDCRRASAAPFVTWGAVSRDKVELVSGELRKVTSETLLEAATTYIDLLAARGAEAIVREENTKLTELLKQALALAKGTPAQRLAKGWPGAIGDWPVMPAARE